MKDWIVVWDSPNTIGRVFIKAKHKASALNKFKKGFGKDNKVKVIKVIEDDLKSELDYLKRINFYGW